MKSVVALGVLGLFAVVACSSSAPIGNGDQNIAIDKATEDPARILPGDFEMRLGGVISTADVGKSFGLDDAHVPYPDTYWPFQVLEEGTNKALVRNGIDHRWQGDS